jgi:hypothetical protein
MSAAPYFCQSFMNIKSQSNMVKRMLKGILLGVLFFLVTAFYSPTIKIAKLKYSGGGDWYANKTSLPNLIRYANQHIGTNIAAEEDIVEPGSEDIFNYPFIHLTGHGNIVFSNQEAENLRNYLIAGGFLHADDNYGMDKFFRREMKKVFPELEFVELPYSHLIYHQKYTFEKGLPKVHEHDGNAPKGFGLIYKGRLVCFYSYECDLGNGWEDADVHNDPEPVRQKALQMGTNILQYAFAN